MTGRARTLGVAGALAAGIVVMAGCAPGALGPQETADKYVQMSAEMMTTAGGKSGGRELTSESDVREVYAGLVCDQPLMQNVVSQWSKLSERRKNYPDLNSDKWTGIKTFFARADKVTVVGDKAHFTITSGDTQTREERTRPMEMTNVDGTWQVCVPAQAPS